MFPRPTAAAALVAVLVTVVGAAWSTRAAGGSDSYGYVSQAYAWLDGGLPVAEPLAREIRVRDAAWVASPLGYRPGPKPGGIVPVYPPGLPLLMAGFLAILGAGGAFLVVPLTGGAAVWATYLLGRRLASPALGACAAALLASNPTFLYQVVQPMSDVPVTALWTAGLVLACGARPRDWALAGVLAGLAILVRPNLAPLAGILAGVATAVAIDDRRATVARIATIGAAIVVPAALGAAAILRLNLAWYGSVSASGYGTADQLFSEAHVWPNLVRYARSVVETNPVVLPLAVAAGLALVVRGRSERPRAQVAALAAWSVAVPALYLSYLSFPEWWYTRFLLPAYPAAMVLALMVLARAASTWRVPSAMAGLVVAAAICGGVWIAYDRSAFDLRRTEARYEDVGRRVQALLPPSAVVFAWQHSGSIRFYGHRSTLRWDLLRPEDLDGLVDRLEAAGRPCYAVLEPHEAGEFLARFAATRTVADGRAGRLFVTPFGIDVLALTAAARTR
jgi:4-amino-4-deoxy-L-arabinose transferase-like glycosyltransferase